MIITGYRIIINQTMNYKTVKRTWKERLFTRPWKPFLKEKSIPDGFSIKDGIFYKTGNILVCNPVTADSLKRNIV